MIEQLAASRRALEDALESYLQTFQTVRQLYVDGQPVNTIHSELTVALVEQFSAIESFKETLDLTKRVIGCSMNASSTLTPIHGLPHEILSSIFEVVMYNGPHAYSFRTWHRRLQSITSVCSHWRRVTLGSPALWTHIDFVVKDPADQAAKTPLASNLELAKVYEQRAAQMLMDVHIIDHNKDTHASSTSNPLAAFVASIAPRIRSFSLSADEPCAYRPVLSALFKNCTLGKFTTLTMDTHSWETHFLDTETQSEFDRNTVLIDVSKQRLDEIYAGITVLDLRLIHPKWDSPAYDGLTELRLNSDEYGSSNVTELQLVEQETSWSIRYL
ncbi:hypothetical protein RSOLAG22IIIB_07268 [Rhizoctonia solani]|uniref:F-box domain-containing protein n=1 Tax=Rhizoctonia solani TaxID=456999 RepID=A0A0K6FLU2_9AGAM|nr:hypothetical protein RSOLAG22IIIB_07268 [Rhizoctonia solani]